MARTPVAAAIQTRRFIALSWSSMDAKTSIVRPAGAAGLPLSSRPVNFLQLLLPDFSLILCGYLVCRYTALNRTVWEQVESLVYFFLFPVRLFQSIVRSPLDLGATSSLIGAGLLMGLSGIAMAYL